jgi:ATP adenylyltransferase
MSHRLWAPWRLAYIEGASEGEAAECLFEALPQAGDDRASLILCRGKTAFVVLNAYPYTNGHLMVAPFRHTAEMGELSDEELLEIHQLVARCLRWIGKAYGPDGFNIGVNLGKAAGAGIPGHIHWHIVPRWNGDTNFMTTVGEARVLPQSLEDSYDRLRAAMESEDEEDA